MKEYLEERFEELLTEYLDENCSTVKEYVDFGDNRFAAVSEEYTDSDYRIAETYAIDKLEEELTEAMNELKREKGFEIEIQELMKKAKTTINNL